MSAHAMTFVKWDVFRTGAGERYSRGYFYGLVAVTILKYNVIRRLQCDRQTPAG